MNLPIMPIPAVMIDALYPHPNADKLEVAQIKGWHTVVAKGYYKVGQIVLYLPIDTVIPTSIESLIFSPDSKIKLKDSRIRTIKIRGVISQGLIISAATLKLPHLELGMDYGANLGVHKYEPPIEGISLSVGSQSVSPKNINPNFLKYTKLENFKNHPMLFESGESIIVTEKIHGTNFRAGYIKIPANTLWKKFLQLIKYLPKYEFIFGSHNQQLSNYELSEPKSIYAKIVSKYNLQDKLKPNRVIYGEIYGHGIQTGYSYGCGKQEFKLAVFDARISGVYLSYNIFVSFCQALGLPSVPLLYRGPYSLETIQALAKGSSTLCLFPTVREGIVIRHELEGHSSIGRKILKFINEEYLLNSKNTDFH